LTTEQVKAWLKRGDGLSREIDRLKATKARAEYRATMTNASIKEKMSTGKKTRNDAALASYADYSAKIDQKVSELQEILNEIQDAIYAVETSDRKSILRTLLVDRYLNFLNWNEIAVSLNYSTEYVRGRLHNNAVFAVAEVLNEKSY